MLPLIAGGHPKLVDPSVKCKKNSQPVFNPLLKRGQNICSNLLMGPLSCSNFLGQHILFTWKGEASDLTAYETFTIWHKNQAKTLQIKNLIMCAMQCWQSFIFNVP